MKMPSDKRHLKSFEMQGGRPYSSIAICSPGPRVCHIGSLVLGKIYVLSTNEFPPMMLARKETKKGFK
jgi:hypothetical protein